MGHWYVYHSVKTMGHSYKSLGKSTVYSSKQQPKLCIGDCIWVVEGDDSQPTEFGLVDCFIYKATDYPPFSAGYAKFKLKASGTSILKGKTLPLDKTMNWFDLLHKKYITKQRFFAYLEDDEDIKNGLLKILGVGI